MTPYERLDFALSEQVRWVKVLEANGCRVELPKPGRELDAPVRMTGFDFQSPNDRKSVSRTALECRTYAKAPLIRDQFGTQHDKRREFFSQLIRAHGNGFMNFYKLNKLRANAIGGFVGHLNAFVGLLDVMNVQSTQADAVRNLYKQIPVYEEYQDYQNLSDTEKVIIARKLDRVARDFLKIVTGLA